MNIEIESMDLMLAMKAYSAWYPISSKRNRANTSCMSPDVNYPIPSNSHGADSFSRNHMVKYLITSNIRAAKPIRKTLLSMDPVTSNNFESVGNWKPSSIHESSEREIRWHVCFVEYGMLYGGEKMHFDGTGYWSKAMLPDSAQLLRTWGE